MTDLWAFEGLLFIGAVIGFAAVLRYFGRRKAGGALPDAEAPEAESPLATTRRRPLVSTPEEAPKAQAGSAFGASGALAAAAEEWQREAEDNDNRHKAELRAHSERAVPPLSDSGREAIERGQHARIAIRHVFPPRLPRRSMSYFGGLPVVPEEFDWPTVHDREGYLERLTFMAQIDCADLPPGPARDLLPGTGTLYFFAPLSDRFGPDARHFVARYVPGKATQTWEPLDMPFTSKLEPRDELERVALGARTHFDRADITFGWIADPSDAEVEARADEGYPHEVADRIRAEKADAFFGPPVPYDPSLSASHAPQDRRWTPYPGFPANWHTARLLRRLVEAWHAEETADVADRLTPSGEVPIPDPEAQRLGQLQTDLAGCGMKIAQAFFPTLNTALKEFDAPPDDVKEDILAFIDELRVTGIPASKDRVPRPPRWPQLVNRWLAFAAVRGAEAGLADPDGAALIPPEAVAALACRHDAREHQLLGLGQVVQVAADEMKDRYLLLLQLAPDEALAWTIGEMGPLQYWITPEDLSARRFENTVLTIEAY